MDIYHDWPEAVALLMLAAGFFLAVLSGSATFQYVLILLAGLVFGRLLHSWKPHKKAAIVLVIIGFLMGYMLGGVWANRKLLVAIYAAGIWAGWQIEKKKLVRAARFES